MNNFEETKTAYKIEVEAEAKKTLKYLKENNASLFCLKEFEKINERIQCSSVFFRETKNKIIDELEELKELAENGISVNRAFDSQFL